MSNAEIIRRMKVRIDTFESIDDVITWQQHDKVIHAFRCFSESEKEELASYLYKKYDEFT